MAEVIYVKGPNGLVFPVSPKVAGGLIRERHVEKSTEAAYRRQQGKSKPAAAPAPPADPPADPPAEGAGGDQWQESPAETVPPASGSVERPAGNASTEAWAEYAVAQGFAEEQLEGLGRDQIRELVDGK